MDCQTLGLQGLGERGGAGCGLVKHPEQEADEIHGLHARRQRGCFVGRQAAACRGRGGLSCRLLPLLLGGIGRGVDGVAAKEEALNLSAAQQEAEMVMQASPQPLLQLLQGASLAGLFDQRLDGTRQVAVPREA